MNKNTIRIIQLTVLVAGLASWIGSSRSLHDDGKLAPRPNLLHLKGSPFGRTLALAMRGPVDVYWHRGEVHEHSHTDGESCAECDRHAQPEPSAHGEECAHGPECEHGEEGTHGQLCEHGEDCEHEAGELCEHEHDEDCEHENHSDHGLADNDSENAAAAEKAGARSLLLSRIERMRKAYYSRTNHRSDSRMHRAYLMGETQRRLEISYHMDPTNLSGYGSYYLFLSESLARVAGEGDESGIIAKKRQEAFKLADYTLNYCLNYPDEAPAMITGATAAHDCLQIHITQENPDMKIAADYLRKLDACLAQYATLRALMVENGLWQNFSVPRRTEMDQAFKLVKTLRDTDHQLFGRLSKNSPRPPLQPRS